jgi:hypothetical protein
MAMLRDAVSAFPEDEWRTGASMYQRPAGLAYHTLETIEFYASGLAAGVFRFGSRFGVDWEAAADEDLPDQPQMLAYLSEMEAMLDEWLAAEDLAAPEETYPWTGAIRLGRVCYLLRHTQHHVAELFLELTVRGISAPDWR